MEKAVLPPLPYELNALEPVISKEIMDFHYNKHHAAYVKNWNAALDKLAEAEAKSDVAAIVGLQPALKFNGGGHVNHSIFWTNLAPVGKGGKVEGALLDALNADFGSLQNFIDRFIEKATSLQGSGWVWLAYCKVSKRLKIVPMDNQDPLSLKGLVPLLGVDVWEHAYYLQYKNVRADYLKEIWKVVNWTNVAERYKNAIKA